MMIDKDIRFFARNRFQSQIYKKKYRIVNHWNGIFFLLNELNDILFVKQK